MNYHKSCLYKYSTRPKGNEDENIAFEENRETSEKDININNKVFEQLNEHIHEKVIKERETWALLGIYSLYNRLFLEEKCKLPHNSSTIMKSHHLLDKILRVNNDVRKCSYKNRVYLHASDMGTEELLQKGFELEDSMTTKIKFIGTAIRKEILEMKVNKLPKRNISVKNIIDGECKVPEALYTLIESIIESPRTKENQKSTQRDIKRKKIQSICDCIILTATSGECKPATCLQLALSVKSLTGSRRVIEILNRLGFSPSYSVTEEIETELAYACAIENSILPYDFRKDVIYDYGISIG